jgi:hypothetical protein
VRVVMTMLKASIISTAKNPRVMISVIPRSDLRPRP